MSSNKIKSDSFIERAKAIHGDKYDYSQTEYINIRTRVSIICPIHGMFWKWPKAHLNGQGCPMCSKIHIADCRRENKWQDFVSEATKRHNSKYSYPYIKDEYENSHSKVTIKCNECGNIFEKIACDHITSKGGGCKVCTTNRRKEKRSISYEDLVRTNSLNLNIVPFEGVKDKMEHITAICPNHGEYSIIISSFLNGKGLCKTCIINNEVEKKKTRYRTLLPQKLRELTHNKCIPHMNTFTDSATRMKFTCSVCGRDYYRKPNDIFNKKIIQPCLFCLVEEQRRKRTKSTEQFIIDAKKIHGDKYDYSNTEYIKSDKKVDVFCKDCGRMFSIEANSHLQGHGCPYHYNNKSQYESEIVDFLKNECNITNILTNDRRVLDGNELDIFLPDYELAIEFDGIFWHSELYKDSNYHLNKTLKCEEKKIRLIHIFEDEWNNKKEIWKSMLRNILGITSQVTYARKCDLRVVPNNEANQFLKANHLQGICGSQIKYGLYYNNELVSIMTFGSSRHFIGNGQSQYELLRFCNKLNTRVIGAASRLFKHFIKTNSPQTVVSFADRRWSNGNLYNQLNFTLYNKSKPNYSYIVKGERKNRFNFRKSILVEKYNCPKEISESDFCKQQGWYKIYDCGCLCFEWKNND